MRTVTLEEHFASPRFFDGPGRELKDQALRFGGPSSKIIEQLCNVGDERIAEMDAAHIDVQVLIDRIMFPADHPYASIAQARGFLDQLPVSAVDRERIAHSNAEGLLGLNPEH